MVSSRKLRQITLIKQSKAKVIKLSFLQTLMPSPVNFTCKTSPPLILFPFISALTLVTNLDSSHCCTPNFPGHGLILQLEFIFLASALSWQDRGNLRQIMLSS